MRLPSPRFVGFTAALLASTTFAWAAGLFQGFPTIGGPSWTEGTVTVPAGPNALTGAEQIPADTNVAQGAGPATVMLPIGAFPYQHAVNRLIGGDFATNLWQRGTSFTGLTPTTTTQTADRWALYSSSNTVTVTKQTGSADTVPAAGLYASMRVNRTSGTVANAICVGQILDKNASAVFLGNNAVFSFWALAGAGLSAAAANDITATIAYYTASDSATANTNSDAFMKATISGYVAVTAISPFTPASGGVTVSSGVVTLPISTTWTRYAVYGLIPTTNTAGTAVTGVGFELCYSPTTGTGASTEWFEFGLAQAQAMGSATSPSLPSGVVSPTGFERRPQAVETTLQQSYSLVLTDVTAGTRYAMCQATTTTVAQCMVQFPTPMREAATLTVSTAASFAATNSGGTAIACQTTTLLGTISTYDSLISCSTTAGTFTAGNAAEFSSANTGGLLIFSAEP